MNLADYSSYLATQGFLNVVRWMPKSAALALAVSLASFYRLFDRRHKEIARTNLRIAFPELSADRREEIVSASYRNLARLLVEVSRLPYLTPNNISRLVRYDESMGLENFLVAQSRGRGVLFLTGHFSSWELFPYSHALYGYPLSFVVRPLDNPYVESLLDRLRRGCGNQTIPKRNSTRHILQALSQGGSIGILIDQNVMPNEGVFVPFFGKLACTTTGLARLALRTGAPVIPGRIQWSNSERIYRMRFWPELELSRTGDKEEDILLNTSRFNQVIEDMIRLEPDSWLWGHRRWHTRPPEDPESPYRHIQ